MRRCVSQCTSTPAGNDEQSRSKGLSTSPDTGSLGGMTAAKQSKRILWIIPKYRAVSADTQPPPLALKNKFWLATQDSFDYSSFVTAGMLAGISLAKKDYTGSGKHRSDTAAIFGTQWQTKPLEIISRKLSYLP
jgi:hypothetical protein